LLEDEPLPLREDIVNQQGATAETITKSAQQVYRNFFVVPKVKE
jgi:hypothetical protein